MTQPNFSFAEDVILPRDSNVVEPCEVRRLTAQNAAILAALQSGPKSRKALADIACNVTARISDLRKAGYVIPPPVEDRLTGQSIYRLAEGHR